MRLLTILLIFSGSFPAIAQPFKEEIQAFLRQDSLQPQAPGKVLFVGSSSFRLWGDVQADFPGTPIINRGFGGSSLPDLIRYEKQIIAPYKPGKIVIYCGENDFAASDTIQAIHVFARFKQLFELIRTDYPQTPIIFVSIKPSISRQRLMPKIAEGNRLIARYLRKKRHTSYVDIYHKMLDAKGQPRPELFVEDKLHMNRAGYLIWQKALTPLLVN